MRKLLLGTASLMIAATAPMAAQAQDVSVSTSIDLVSDYVFRGVSLADTAIQPGVEVAVGDFTVGGWFSTGVGETSALALDEIASVGFDTVLAPSATVYYDLTLESLTLEGGIGHSIATGDKTSLDLGATVGLVDGDGFSYEYGSASAAVGYAFTDAVSTYVGVNYVLSSEDTLDYRKILQGGGESDLFWAGVGVAAGF